MSILAINSFTSLHNERILGWCEVLWRVFGPGIMFRWVTPIWASVTPDRFPPPCSLPGPLALCHHLHGSVQSMARKKSAGVLQVCGPNWHVCEADYSCFGIGSETAWILWLISFSGKEAVTRVSCCPGWVKSWCSAGSRAGFAQARTLWPIWPPDSTEQRTSRSWNETGRSGFGERA